MRTVLLVDDSPVARRVVTQRLVAEGYEVIEAASVAAARKIDVTPLGCAIVDLELPDGDGTDLARFLSEKRQNLPIAFFTQGTAPSLIEGARGRGTVFLKPDLNPLVAWVKRAVRSSQPPPTK
jgi:two-component system, NtrC family, response regulator PilR